MPRHSLEVHPEAAAEAHGAVQWYRVRNEAVADAFIDEIDHAIGQIEEAPDRWPRYVQGTRRYLLHRFPFYVVYRKIGSTIQVIAVAHGHRKPGYWKTR
jgi:plasmid stabilization system protein ParE